MLPSSVAALNKIVTRFYKYLTLALKIGLVNLYFLHVFSMNRFIFSPLKGGPP